MLRQIGINGFAVALVLALVGLYPSRARARETSASSDQPSFAPAGSIDGDRFSSDADHAWKGSAEAQSWWWQCRWDEPRQVGAILQIFGDDPLLMQNAPRQYVWQSSLDGQSWSDLEETAMAAERRMFRLQRLKGPRRLQYLRLKIDAAHGKYPTLREVEVFDNPQAKVAFPDWIAADKPWDCPHCRDPKNPKSPIYGHIGHTGSTLRKCGDYSECLFERGKTHVLGIADDPVLAGLSREFEIMESHCGQIEYLPTGWVQIVARGAGGKTNMQCMRMKDRYIYAAQFHIEMAGTPENSRQMMANFLQLARDWGGYNPDAKPVAVPERLATPR